MSPHLPGATVSSSHRPSHERQQELLQRIGRELVEVSPDGWFRIDLRASSAITTDWMALTVLMPHGSGPYVDLPLSVGRALRELREVMYVEGRGTWFSLRYTMDSPVEFHVTYNYDFDPKWSPDPNPHEWALDLEHFPRDAKHTPGWLHAKLPVTASVDADEPTANADDMSEPLNPVQQNEVLAQITDWLVHELPSWWNRLQIDYKALGDHVEVGGLLRMTNGAMYGWDLPEEVRKLFDRLRAGMSRPETGTWLHATYWVDYPDLYAIEYDRQNKPDFRTPPPPEAYAKELENFPRTDKHVPDWLRAATV